MGPLGQNERYEVELYCEEQERTEQLHLITAFHCSFKQSWDITDPCRSRALFFRNPINRLSRSMWQLLLTTVGSDYCKMIKQDAFDWNGEEFEMQCCHLLKKLALGTGKHHLIWWRLWNVGRERKECRERLTWGTWDLTLSPRDFIKWVNCGAAT